MFLRPAQAARCAEHLQGQAVLAADGDGRRPQPADRAAIHAEIDHRVVLELAACNARREVGGPATPVVEPGTGTGGPPGEPVPADGALYWVAAEGLKFRASSHNHDDDNVLAEVVEGHAYQEPGRLRAVAAALR